MNVYGVIMAGGGGTRFWPLSRQSMPKQLLNISGKDVLINETIDRISPLVKKDNVIIVTNSMQSELLKDTVKDKCDCNNVISEPMARNTAACICLAAIVINKKFGNGVMCVFPSDHYIKDEDSFNTVLRNAVIKAEQSDNLLTIGIKPTFPSTGYGYINFKNDNTECSEVIEFVEKPNYETAKGYIENGNYLWNSGMFIWKVSTILECFKRYLPRIYNKLIQIEGFIGTEEFDKRLQDIYLNLPSISIDYGIMERADNVLVIPGNFGWNDVGSWDALGTIFPTDDNGNIIRADYVGIDTNNSIVYSEHRMIATIGLKEIIIVDANDALLVCPKDKAQDVKKIVDILKNKGKDEFIL